MSQSVATLQAKTVASGCGWRVEEMICTAGPRDRPFEERHHGVSVAAVVSGTFQYRTAQGSAVLAPGAILLGNHGACFECGHEHGAGDRCLSVHFTPDCWEGVVSGVPGARNAVFEAPCVPPAPGLLRVVAALEAACGRGAGAVEEAVLEFAGAALSAASTLGVSSRSPSARDERRITQALRRIETAAHDLQADELTVSRLASDARMTPYHFLRTFRRVVGMTPHQYVLHRRMIRAAVRLRLSDEPVSTIAYESGFNDLSTFNRRFRRLTGASPGTYRAAARARG